MNGNSLDSRASVSVLLASPVEEDHSSLREILARSPWRLIETRTCQGALTLIKRHGVTVVICEKTLPDGNWRTLLGATADMPQRPQIIVTSRLADHHLWVDVLELGGYDLLMTPFDPTEVSRVVSMALFSSRRAHTQRAASSGTAA